jgi:thioredoxin 1
MVLEVNNDNLEEVLAEKSVTILQFSAMWCGPCKMLTPVMLKLSEENADKDIRIGKVNVDSSSEIGVKYGVRSIPTLVFLKDGVEVERTVGVQTHLSLQEKIDTLLN